MSGAEITATSIATSRSGMTLGVATPWGRGELRTSLVGTFNASNLLGTLGVLLASGVPLDDALAAMDALTPPPGRMERHGGGEQPLVVIDYAHTPDALEKVLTALRPSVRDGSSLVCVFGAGGDRDPGKRPEMGRIAASLADRVVVTSDNPRSEDPTAIAMAIAQGVRAAGNRHWILEVDRAKAIRGAIAAGRAGDVIVLAGKGHETYQEIAGEKHPFSDAAEAESALAAMEPRMMDLATAARDVQGRVSGQNVAFSRVTSDSRTLEPGDLFVALAGERFDGHDYVAQAIERGAAGALVSDARAPSLQGNLIVVDDTLAALGRLAAAWRARFTFPLAVVVGSNGKTTVKEMTAAALSAHFGAMRCSRRAATSTTRSDCR